MNGSFHRSIGNILVIAEPKQLNRMRYVITTALHLHVPTDHELWWIQTKEGECQGRRAHTTLCCDEHGMAGRTLHQWDSIMTHLY